MADINLGSYEVTKIERKRTVTDDGRKTIYTYEMKDEINDQKFTLKSPYELTTIVVGGKWSIDLTNPNRSLDEFLDTGGEGVSESTPVQTDIADDCKKCGITFLPGDIRYSTDLAPDDQYCKGCHDEMVAEAPDISEDEADCKFWYKKGLCSNGDYNYPRCVGKPVCGYVESPDHAETDDKKGKKAKPKVKKGVKLADDIKLAEGEAEELVELAEGSVELLLVLRVCVLQLLVVWHWLTLNYNRKSLGWVSIRQSRLL